MLQAGKEPRDFCATSIARQFRRHLEGSNASSDHVLDTTAAPACIHCLFELCVVQDVALHRFAAFARAVLGYCIGFLCAHALLETQVALIIIDASLGLWQRHFVTVHCWSLLFVCLVAFQDPTKITSSFFYCNQRLNHQHLLHKAVSTAYSPKTFTAFCAKTPADHGCCHGLAVLWEAVFFETL